MSRSEQGASPTPSVFELLAADANRPGGPGIARGVITEILDTGEIAVQTFSEGTARIRCDFLETGQGLPPSLEPGDIVLVLAPQAPAQNGCVLGRVGRYQRPETIEDHVVIEAGEMLSLVCGESSINLRKDGKVLIRGADVLSKAERTQRIKGGTVAIN